AYPAPATTIRPLIPAVDAFTASSIGTAPSFWRRHLLVPPISLGQPSADISMPGPWPVPRMPIVASSEASPPGGVDGTGEHDQSAGHISSIMPWLQPDTPLQVHQTRSDGPLRQERPDRASGTSSSAIHLAEHCVEFRVGPELPDLLRTAARDGD